MKEVWTTDPDRLSQETMFTPPGPRHFERATLGGFFFSLVIHADDILNTEISDDLDLRSLARGINYLCPVMVDALVVKIMRISKTELDEYQVTGGMGRGRGSQRIAEILQKHPARDGYSIYMCALSRIGSFIVVKHADEDKSLVYAQLRYVAEFFGAKQLQDDIYEPVLLSDARRLIVQELRKYQDRWGDDQN